MKIEVPLLKFGEKIAYAQVDEADAEIASTRVWHLSGNGYAISGQKIGFRHTALYLHRLIANPPEGKVVDHKNGDRLDNRRENLRICTYAQNGTRQQDKRKNLFGRGIVQVQRKSGRIVYYGYVTVDGRVRNTTQSDTPEEAREKWRALAVALLGAFAPDSALEP